MNRDELIEHYANIIIKNAPKFDSFRDYEVVPKNDPYFDYNKYNSVQIDVRRYLIYSRLASMDGNILMRLNAHRLELNKATEIIADTQPKAKPTQSKIIALLIKYWWGLIIPIIGTLAASLLS